MALRPLPQLSNAADDGTLPEVRKIPGSRLRVFDHVAAIMLANPTLTDEEMAAHLRWTLSKLRRTLNNPDFQHILEVRRERFCASIIKEAQAANHIVHMKALSTTTKKLDSFRPEDLVRLVDVTAKNSGVQSQKGPTVAVQTNFKIEWADGSPAAPPPIDIEPSK